MQTVNHQRSNLLAVLARKSQSCAAAGGDGFVAADSLRFDVGLSTQAIRRYLDAATANGMVEHRQAATGQRHVYKPADGQ
ncbi:hypothetical protein KOEU_37170 [Komagataeibacter europaeus]|uniref:Uncharacterized protein n=1 Tax=Komagataeibacter europaeus TaxID=33995 RepID=A0A0M0EC10_KOMEU|nr:hypothetical protein [Komagataeibacter europaeus]KON62799.1 hypothetical protein KOEU_37170 [Komagataeibacter europaeus]